MSKDKVVGIGSTLIFIVLLILMYVEILTYGHV